MTLHDVIAAIGWSHLLQPPLTLYLGSDRGLGLKRSIYVGSPIAHGVAHNMAFTSVTLPTSLGVMLALHANGVRPGDAAASLGWLLTLFWSWRLYRQWRLWPAWPSDRWPSFWVLAAIFVAQGPVLGLLLTAVLF
ncbi:MAG TPA: hypothetical protein VJN18_11525 [Polyangiaceae bacterium]|nr:hypothetical protein [Polyangiaceae bacterium]